LSIQYLTKLLIKQEDTNSVTITIQEGQGAGQAINHLHVHIIPRRGTDGLGDTIYQKLEKFDESFL